MMRLSSPFTIRGMRLRNRMVRSATAERLADAAGIPSFALDSMYHDLAVGGIGLLITGHAFVHRGGQCHAEMSGIHCDTTIPRWRELVQIVQAAGARIAVQINHGGRACEREIVPDPLAPSPVPLNSATPPPTELSVGEIEEIIAAFGAAAGRAREAGFDAVQIHSAHGYLSSQFLSPLTNLRQDEYGGDLRGRTTFLRRVAARVRGAVGPDYPVLIKLGVNDYAEGGLSREDGAQVAAWLEDVGIDAIEVSAGLKGAVKRNINRVEREAYLEADAAVVRERTSLPLIVVGGLRSQEVIEKILSRGFEMVSFCRPLIRQPDLPRRLASGEIASADCLSCNLCWPREAGEGVSCTTLAKLEARDRRLAGESGLEKC